MAVIPFVCVRRTRYGYSSSPLLGRAGRGLASSDCAGTGADADACDADSLSSLTFTSASGASTTVACAAVVAGGVGSAAGGSAAGIGVTAGACSDDASAGSWTFCGDCATGDFAAVETECCLL
jgi:hypothetical protein